MKGNKKGNNLCVSAVEVQEEVRGFGEWEAKSIN